MATIRAKESFRVSPEQLWRHMTDADLLGRLGAFDSLRAVESCERGLFAEGAVREVRMGPMRFIERIANVNVNRSLEVEILEQTGPIRQEYERVELEPTSGGCQVTWTIRFRMNVPVLESLVSPIVATLATLKFKSFVRKFKRYVEAAEVRAPVPLPPNASSFSPNRQTISAT